MLQARSLAAARGERPIVAPPESMFVRVPLHKQRAERARKKKGQKERGGKIDLSFSFPAPPGGVEAREGRAV